MAFDINSIGLNKIFGSPKKETEKTTESTSTDESIFAKAAKEKAKNAEEFKTIQEIIMTNAQLEKTKKAMDEPIKESKPMYFES